MQREQNLRQLEKRYRDRMQGRFGQDSMVVQRQEALRRPEAPREILSFYSLIEIGCLAGVLPRPLPSEFRDLALAQLPVVFAEISDFGATALCLPKLLQARLYEQWGHRDDEGSDATLAIFSQLLAINAMVEDDPDVRLFLSVLKDVPGVPCSWEEMLRAVESLTVEVPSPIGPSLEHEGATHCLLGFIQYLDYLPEITHLLDLARDYPYLQSGIWHYHSEVIADSTAMGKLHLLLAAAEDGQQQQASEDAEGISVQSALSKLVTEPYESLLLEDARRLPPLILPEQPITPKIVSFYSSALRGLMVGESLVGDGNEVAHIDLMIGPKNGPVGAAFANRLAQQTAGHSALLAVLAPNWPAKPSTVMFNKVTIKGATQAVQMFGPAQAAVAKAVVDSVSEGIISAKDAEDLVVVVGVFIHWKATDKKKIYDYNYKATKESIQRALSEQPSMSEILATKFGVKHPFA